METVSGDAHQLKLLGKKKWKLNWRNILTLEIKKHWLVKTLEDPEPEEPLNSAAASMVDSSFLILI